MLESLSLNKSPVLHGVYWYLMVQTTFLPMLAEDKSGDFFYWLWAGCANWFAVAIFQIVRLSNHKSECLGPLCAWFACASAITWFILTFAVSGISLWLGIPLVFIMTISSLYALFYSVRSIYGPVETA